MGRPINADADATRARILQSALHLFSAHGIDGASIREVAKGAGVSLAMVHHYFGTKDDLHRAVIDSMYAELATMREMLVTAIAGSESIEDLIESAVVEGYRFARTHVTEVRLMLRDAVLAGELPRGGRESLEPFLDLASERLAPLVARPPESLRMPLQSIVFLVARYAVQSDAESAIVTGATAIQAPRAIEQHLIELARTLLMSPRKSPSSDRLRGPARSHPC
jgi:TetR/AcrR family transcriptional regulator